jgi:ligand-binding SRPBCC domain-containing protein
MTTRACVYECDSGTQLSESELNPRKIFCGKAGILLMQFEQWVPFPLERVFRFFANPENLPRIMPPSLGMKIVHVNLVRPAQAGLPAPVPANLLAGVGSEIVTSFRLIPFLPIRIPWVARITEFEWLHHFADIQERGPLRRWHHRHEFAAESREEGDGTRVRDVVEYEFGLGPLESSAKKLAFDPQMRRVFAHRQKVLEELLAAAGH